MTRITLSLPAPHEYMFFAAEAAELLVGSKTEVDWPIEHPTRRPGTIVGAHVEERGAVLVLDIEVEE